MRRDLVVAVAVVALLGGCKRKPKLEGKVTGFKPGTDTLMMHVVTEKGMIVSCEPPGYGCKLTDVGPTGQADIELDTSGQNDQKVHLKAQLGPKENQIVLDPATSMPPTVKVSPNRSIACFGRDCSGSVDVVPWGHIQLKAPAGTLVEVGSDKLTVGADGSLDSLFNFTPALKDQLLSKVLAKDSVTFGSSSVSLTFPDKAKTSSKFDLTTEGAAGIFAIMFKDAARGPLLFPWEKGVAPKGKPVAVFCRGLCYLGGAADATLADLRVIVLTEDKQLRKAPCSYVMNNGQKATANLTMHDELATAYERATGKKLGTKVFTAPNQCSWEVTAKVGASLSDQDSHPDGAPIARWGATLAK
jgi:hypothetical protein